MDFGYSIRKLRLEVNMSQKDLVKATKSSKTYISQIENGHLNPSHKFINKIAECLNVEPDLIYLLAIEPDHI